MSSTTVTGTASTSNTRVIRRQQPSPPRHQISLADGLAIVEA